MYALVRWVILLFLAGVYALIHVALRRAAIDVGLIVMLATGVLFVVLGNVMGKLRPNWFVGIRTPWTLSSKRSWTRTHAVGGRVFMIIGAVFIVAGISRAPFAVPVTAAIAMLGTVYLLAYSYVVWRSDTERIPPAGTLPTEQP